MCMYQVLHFYVTNQSSLLDIQAAERISKLLAMMPPAVYAELTMLMAIQLQEGVENVLASQHAGPNIAPLFPVSVGITTASNVAPSHKKATSTESSTFRR